MNKGKEELLKKAIKDGGYYGKKNVWNSIKTFPSDKNIYRERIETIIVRNGKEVFLKKKPNNDYFLPGGSTEKGVSHEQQAINECHEEAHINVKNIKFTGYTYKELRPVPEWVKREGELEWNGNYTEVYIAEYDSHFKGDIKDVDQDPFILSGKWYSVKECLKIFRKEHRAALLEYIKNYTKKAESKQGSVETVTESYITNYFKNKKLLKTITKNPELSANMVKQMIEACERKYKDLAAKSSVKRERKKNTSEDTPEQYVYILSYLSFENEDDIALCAVFNDHVFTPAMACKMEDLGDVVIFYPKFFNMEKENQIYIFLHEIGHIRLRHIAGNNYHKNIFLQDNTMDYRRKLMKNNKVMYPEANADIYAIINGAKFYSILDTVKKDIDGNLDYRYTNGEFANRYKKAMDYYLKNKDQLDQMKQESMMDLGFNDVTSIVLYEEVYESENTSNLSDNDKNSLFKILNEFAINKNTDRIDSICNSFMESTNDQYFVETSNIALNIFNSKRQAAKEYLVSEATNIIDKLSEGTKNKKNDRYIKLLKTYIG